MIFAMNVLPEQLHVNFQNTWTRLSRCMRPTQSWPASTDLCREQEQMPFAKHIVLFLPCADHRVANLGNRAGNLAMLHGKWILRGTWPDYGQILREGRDKTNRSHAAGSVLAYS